MLRITHRGGRVREARDRERPDLCHVEFEVAAGDRLAVELVADGPPRTARTATLAIGDLPNIFLTLGPT